jgi:hypothetical protein
MYDLITSVLKALVEHLSRRPSAWSEVIPYAAPALTTLAAAWLGWWLTTKTGRQERKHARNAAMRAELLNAAGELLGRCDLLITASMDMEFSKSDESWTSIRLCLCKLKLLDHANLLMRLADDAATATRNHLAAAKSQTLQPLMREAEMKKAELYFNVARDEVIKVFQERFRG